MLCYDALDNIVVIVVPVEFMVHPNIIFGTEDLRKYFSNVQWYQYHRHSQGVQHFHIKWFLTNFQKRGQPYLKPRNVFKGSKRFFLTLQSYWFCKAELASQKNWTKMWCCECDPLLLIEWYYILEYYIVYIFNLVWDGNYINSPIVGAYLRHNHQSITMNTGILIMFTSLIYTRVSSERVHLHWLINFSLVASLSCWYRLVFSRIGIVMVSKIISR